MYDSSMDMWSAGVVFAEMACGRNLFTGGSEIAILLDMYR
jgi:serine/threonine protein kinase